MRNAGIIGRVAVVAILCTGGLAAGQDWGSVPILSHSAYQAVTSTGGSAYGGGFPVRLVGVVLNNTEDWLDPTPAYDPDVHYWRMGGEAEFFVQAVDLDGTPWDPDPAAAFSDFGGTACWMGQNYGNHIWHGDPMYSYTDAQWAAELARLNLLGGDGVTDPIRGGDLVEVRARAGLNYQGKMNVNEYHDSDFDREDDWDGYGSPGDGENHDFEVVRLVKGYGLPHATEIPLQFLKNEQDAFLFDPGRAVGGERYQSERVRLMRVWTTTTQSWAAKGVLTVTDGLRTFTLRLGFNAAFDGTELFAPGESFDVVGIMNQSDPTGRGGYNLLVMSPADVHLASLPGDLNHNGVVDLDDLTVLGTFYGRPGPLGWRHGDFNFDGMVDLDDLTLLGTFYGMTRERAAIPEPATLALLTVLGAAGLSRRRH